MFHAFRLFGSSGLDIYSPILYHHLMHLMIHKASFELKEYSNLAVVGDVQEVTLKASVYLATGPALLSKSIHF